MTVAFLGRTRKLGNKAVVGPVTGIHYVITSEGTPVSIYDVDELLTLTEPPCCGESLPFGGEIRSFGRHVATQLQVESVPDYIWDAKPMKAPSKSKGKRKKLYDEYERPGEPVLVVEQADEPVEESKTEEE